MIYGKWIVSKDFHVLIVAILSESEQDAEYYRVSYVSVGKSFGESLLFKKRLEVAYQPTEIDIHGAIKTIFEEKLVKVTEY